MDQTPKDLTREVARALQDCIRDADLSQRAVERELGWSNSYLSSLIHGRVDLKVVQIFRVLEVISTRPSDFLDRVASRPLFKREKSEQAGDLIDAAVDLFETRLQELLDARLTERENGDPEPNGEEPDESEPNGEEPGDSEPPLDA